MSTQIEIDLFDTKGLTEALEWLYNNIDKQAEEMIQELAKNGETFLASRYIGRFKDANISDISTSTNKISNGYEIKAQGKDVVYEEFGTGDEGESHSHPEKSRYNLNDYNSGPYIRNVSDVPEDSYTGEDLQQIGITSGKFWRYNKDGVVHYTQGVPAGQEMWDTRNYIINEMPNVVKKRGKIINDNIIRSIER